MYQWRRFQFFEKESVKVDLLKSETGPLEWKNIECSASGRGYMVFGDRDGFIRLVDRNYSVLQFRVFDRRVALLQQLKARGVLVCVGDELVPRPAQVLKVFHIDDTAVEKGESPALARTVIVDTLLGGRFAGATVTTMAVAEDLSQVALGYENGAIVLLRGDVVRDRHPRQMLLRAEENDPTKSRPITGLCWCIGGQSSRSQTGRPTSSSGTHGTGGLPCLYAVTPSSVSSFAVGSKDAREEVLDDMQGCERGRAVVSEDGELVKGVKEGAFFYQPDGRGGCIAFDGQKQLLCWFRSYLLMVVDDRSGARPVDVLHVFDRKNKFIAFSSRFDDPIRHIVCEWGFIFVLTEQGMMFRMEEKDMQTKLQLLFRKNLYTIALSLAHSQQYDSAAIADIFKEYGDHLYNKQDYDGAISQYLQTVGRLEPSYVIRKFLDAQRIHNLTKYLEALHFKGLATADHTTLLLNCYTKLKDESNLDRFIQDDTLHFEVHTAIRVCRQAGYAVHALRLAKQYKEHDWFVKIQLEDVVGGHSEALAYIERLVEEGEREVVETLLHKYGRPLLSALPEQTTGLLIQLCLRSGAHTGAVDGDKELMVGPTAESVLHVFAEHPRCLTTFLEALTTPAQLAVSPVSPTLWNTLFELYLRSPDSYSPSVGVESPEARDLRLSKAMALLQRADADYDADQVLFLAQLHSFPPGILFLLEKLKLYHEIVEYYMQHNEYDSVIRSCKKYGENDANLWIKVLSYFAGKSDDCQKEIVEILQTVDRGNLLPPLQVIFVLSQSKTASLGMVKDYVTRRLHQESVLISDDNREIRRYREETEHMRKELLDLRSCARIFQQSKCSACRNQLDHPTVHFLCMHSFHGRCVGDSTECPECLEKIQMVMKRKQDMERDAGRHDEFFRQLENDPDGFATVSQYFGRCVFGGAGSSSTADGADVPDGLDLSAVTPQRSSAMGGSAGGVDLNFDLESKR